MVTSTTRVPGAAMHGLLDDEVAEIVALYAEWGEIDRSHRGPVGHERQRPTDDVALDAGVHGAVRHPPALRPPQHPDRPGVDRVAVRPRQIENPHLLTIRDPVVLRVELAIVRQHYNTLRLHAGIGYVTPDDEHARRGAAIRKAREAGLEAARLRRLTYHRQQRQPEPTQETR